MSILDAPHFHDEQAAYEFVEARVWPDGPVCPHCGAAKEHVGQLKGKSTRIGTYKCYACRKPFTVKVGTVFEASHIPLHLWLQAIFLMCSSKKGISSNQLHRTLGVTLKSAWFMSHRIRAAMDSKGNGSMGTGGKFVEVDETYIGREPNVKKPRGGWRHKLKVVGLVERGGAVQTVHMTGGIKRSDMLKLLFEKVSREASLMTDESNLYMGMGKYFGSHDKVNHSIEEYVRGDAHTNTIEGYFSIFKRGMRGVYQHCDKKHLHRYLAEFDFRYNNRIALGTDDAVRTDKALVGIKGKRLTYRTTNRQTVGNN